MSASSRFSRGKTIAASRLPALSLAEDSAPQVVVNGAQNVHDFVFRQSVTLSYLRLTLGSERSRQALPVLTSLHHTTPPVAHPSKSPHFAISKETLNRIIQ